MLVRLRKKRITNIGWIMWNRERGVPAFAFLDPYTKEVVVFVDPLVPELEDLEVIE